MALRMVIVNNYTHFSQRCGSGLIIFSIQAPVYMIVGYYQLIIVQIICDVFGLMLVHNFNMFNESLHSMTEIVCYQLKTQYYLTYFPACDQEKQVGGMIFIEIIETMNALNDSETGHKRSTLVKNFHPSD